MSKLHKQHLDICLTKIGDLRQFYNVTMCFFWTPQFILGFRLEQKMCSHLYFKTYLEQPKTFCIQN